MKLPFIVIVDDDMQVLRSIQRDVRNEYRQEYRIIATGSANEAIELIKELKLKNEAVALITSSGHPLPEPFDPARVPPSATSATITRAPSRAICNAVARPMPDAAAVTIATLPVSLAMHVHSSGG